MAIQPAPIDLHAQATKLVVEALTLCEQAGLELVVMLLEDAVMVLGEEMAGRSR
jgi:hypothetical protein